MVKAPFTGDRYYSIHQAMVSLIDGVEEHEYHGAKLNKLLQRIAIEGE